MIFGFLPKNVNDSFGIIHSFRDNLFIYVDTSSNYSNSRDAESILNPESNKDWQSADGDKTPNLSVYFTHNPIYLSHYSIESSRELTHAKFPVCWDFYGYNSSFQWQLISSIQESGLTRKNQTIVFPVFDKGPYTAFKIAMTCHNADESDQENYFILHSIDFFGVVSIYQTFKMTKFPIHSPFFIFLALFS